MFLHCVKPITIMNYFYFWKSDLRFTWIIVDERRYCSRWRVRLIVAAVVVVFALDLAAPSLLAILSFLEAVAFVVNSFQHSSAKLLFYFLLVAGLAERRSIFLIYHSQMLFVKIIWQKIEYFLNLAARCILMTAQILIMFLARILIVMNGAAKMSGWCCLNAVSVTWKTIHHFKGKKQQYFKLKQKSNSQNTKYIPFCI